MMLKKRILIIVILTFICWLLYLIATNIGVNVSSSVPFRFYTYETIENRAIKQSDYVMFRLPMNDLYPKDIIAVKQVACVEHQYLKTYSDKVYCDRELIFDYPLLKTQNIKHTFHYEGFIPKDNFFLLGKDNKSFDSRYWGFIKRDEITNLVHPLGNIFLATAHAKEPNRFYGDKDRGWYKYEVIPSEQDNKSEEKKYKVEKPFIPWDYVDNMSTGQFKKLFEQVEDYAMSNRSLSTFNDYARLRTVMLNRSMEFMNVGTLWAQLNPEATSETWYPTSGYGRESYQSQINSIRQEYIRKNKDSFGMLYFYRDSCQYCTRQTPIVNYFQDDSTWSVKFVNTDMMPEIMARFNVDTVPTLILVDRRSEKWMLLSSGLMTLDDIEERLYRTIKYLNGESDEKTFDNPIRPDNFIKQSSLR